MSGLTSALSSALTGLMVTSSQSAVVSRNVTRASEENYTRKALSLTTDLAGNARAASIVRVAEDRLLESVNTSNAAREGQSIVNDALKRISESVGDVEADGSIAWGVGQLQIALADFEASPGSRQACTQAVAAAQRVAESINSAASLVSDLRAEADAGIVKSVGSINEMLAEIQDLTTRITTDKGDGANLSELLDQRDSFTKRLSAELGIRTISKPNNGIAIYTDSGVTLFDITARRVSFAASSTLPAGVSGNAVYIDGVQVTGAGAPMPLQNGRIAAQVQVRDKISTDYQNQLDEIGRGLVTQFSEADQGIPATLPNATGLFSYSGSPSVPIAATVYPGLAGGLRINSQYDLASGGNPLLLRDGGANGVAYVYNISGQTGFQTRLSALVSGLGGNAGFASVAGLDTNTSIQSFAAQSAGWIEQKRADSTRSLDVSLATFQRATDALNKKSGVNIDEEMATLLNLEKSYQAAAKVMTTVDQMLATLMQIVR